MCCVFPHLSVVLYEDYNRWMRGTLQYETFAAAPQRPPTAPMQYGYCNFIRDIYQVQYALDVVRNVATTRARQGILFVSEGPSKHYCAILRSKLAEQRVGEIDSRFGGGEF